MNIFVLSKIPEKCARMHADTHVVKMILETAQMLSTAHWIHTPERGGPYKRAYEHHPCTQWVAETGGNYRWTFQLFYELCKEYDRRYGRTHKCWDLAEEIWAPPKPIAYLRASTPFVLAMPEEFKADDAVASYRAYYRHKMLTLKRHMTWHKQFTPPHQFTLGGYYHA